MRRCSKCKEYKSIDDFSYIKSQKKYQSWCKSCMKSYWETSTVREDQKLRKRELRILRKSKGLCQTCGKPVDRVGKSACDFCIDKIKKYGKTDKGKAIHERARKQRFTTPKGILVRIKRSAINRGLEFNLTEEDIIIPTHCPLLGIPITFNNKNGSKDKHGSASVDRIDNSKGYVKGNVWVICYLANMMKQDASIEELRTFAKNVLIHFPD